MRRGVSASQAAALEVLVDLCTFWTSSPVLKLLGSSREERRHPLQMLLPKLGNELDSEILGSVGSTAAGLSGHCQFSDPTSDISIISAAVGTTAYHLWIVGRDNPDILFEAVRQPMSTSTHPQCRCVVISQ